MRSTRQSSSLCRKDSQLLPQTTPGKALNNLTFVGGHQEPFAFTHAVLHWMLIVDTRYVVCRDASIIEAGKAETEKLGTQISIPDALRFRGVGPEFINSRLAMVCALCAHD